MNLSITYDCLPNDLPIPKLESYGLDMGRISLLRNYITNCEAKVGSSHGDCFEFISGTPKDSIRSIAYKSLY